MSIYKKITVGLGRTYIGHPAHLQQLNLYLEDFDAIWLPHYGKNNGAVTSKPDFPCDIHQFTDKEYLMATVDIQDLNRLTGTKSIDFLQQQKRGGQDG